MCKININCFADFNEDVKLGISRDGTVPFPGRGLCEPKLGFTPVRC